MKQLFANNAKTTLKADLQPGITTFEVVNASLFPNPTTDEYFLITIELGGVIEIIPIVSVIGNIFTASARGTENTNGPNGYSFPAGARVECRVTKETLDNFSTTLVPFASVENLVSPAHSKNDGYICQSFDPVGNPVMVVAKSSTQWRFLNYTQIFSGTVTSASTTQVTATSIPLTDVTAGKYLLQLTSGPYVGQVRPVATIAANSATWTSALATAPDVGTTFEILKADSSIRLDGTYYYGVGTGTGNSITVEFTPAPESLFTGLELRLRTPGANSSTAPSLVFHLRDGSSVTKTITANGGSTIPTNAYGTNYEITLRYNPALASGAGAFELIAAAGVTTFNSRSGAVTLTSTDVTNALTYTPYNGATNPNAYITAASIPSAPVTTVNGASGAVVLKLEDIKTNLSGILWGTGATGLGAIARAATGAEVVGTMTSTQLINQINGTGAYSYIHYADTAGTAGTAGSATSATTAGKASNVAGGGAGQLVYNYAVDSTSFITPGASGTLLTSNGAGQAPSFQTSPLPPGMVAHFAAANAPGGWIVCDGRDYPTTGIYAELFGAIGYTHGKVGGQFCVPNLMGRFIRGSDGSSNPLGVYQEDMVSDHIHTFYVGQGTGPASNPSRSMFGWNLASYTNYSSTPNSIGRAGNGSLPNGSGTTTANIGIETRPKNVPLLACIKL